MSLTFWSKVDSSGGPLACWPWQGTLDKDGYGKFNAKRAHRRAYEMSTRRALTRVAIIRHTCDNPRCCNPLHLIPGVQLQNVADRVERDRSAKGTANGKALLSEMTVLAIYYSPGSYADIGRQFGLPKGTVSDIKNGRNWGWLTGANSHGNQTVPNVLRTSETTGEVSR